MNASSATSSNVPAPAARIEVRGLQQSFRTARGPVQALGGVDLDVGQGEMVLVRGPSGSGKTSLLLAVGGLRRPSAGEVRIDGTSVQSPRFDRRQVGFVFQTLELLPYLDVVDNVLLGVPDRERARARSLLDELGLGERMHHRPAELSVGERQRVALARALLPRPAVVLADEPTGNLDRENAAMVFLCLDRYRRDGAAVLVATHTPEHDALADRVLHLERGHWAERSGPAPSPSNP